MRGYPHLYRVVQLALTPEIEVFYVLFDRSLSIFSTTSLKHRMKYLHFRCKIQLDLPVQLPSSPSPSSSSSPRSFTSPRRARSSGWSPSRGRPCTGRSMRARARTRALNLFPEVVNVHVEVGYNCQEINCNKCPEGVEVNFATFLQFILVFFMILFCRHIVLLPIFDVQ